MLECLGLVVQMIPPDSLQVFPLWIGLPVCAAEILIIASGRLRPLRVDSESASREPSLEAFIFRIYGEQP